jgi:hypothetical protein
MECVWCGEAGIRFRLHDEAMRRQILRLRFGAASAFVLCTQGFGRYSRGRKGVRPATCTSTECAAVRWLRYPYRAYPTTVRDAPHARLHGHGVDGRTVWLIYSSSRTGRDVDGCRARWCLLLASTAGLHGSASLVSGDPCSRRTRRRWGSECGEDTVTRSRWFIRLGFGGSMDRDGELGVGMAPGANRIAVQLWRLVHATHRCVQCAVLFTA